MQPQIAIVMATYNGAAYLAAQIDSILAQTFSNWRLIVSDDGSADETRDIVRHYTSRLEAGRITLIDGPCRGATANFLHLIRQVAPGNWIAFCDQDDIWRDDKLARGVDYLRTQFDASVYAARTTICDENMRPLRPAPHLPGPFGFRNALIQACLPGNTIIANAAALELLRAGAAAAERADVISHDWWIYQILAGAGANIYRDSAQVVLYRQHPQNVMGRNDTARARAARASMLFDGSFADWLARNHAALASAAHLLLPENRQFLRQFDQMTHASGPQALARFLSLKLYRQSRGGTAAVMAAALAGCLKPRKPPSQFAQAEDSQRP